MENTKSRKQGEMFSVRGVCETLGPENGIEFKGMLPKNVFLFCFVA